ncbi:MAG: helix-turn-helix transcriptional regulator [Pseudomonadota bacterium]
MEDPVVEDAAGKSENWYGDEAATFGDRVTAGREAVGLSAAELAQRLGVTEDTLAAWEQDMSGPRSNRLQMLAAVLNVPLRWLVTGEGAAPSEAGQLSEADTSAILEEIRALRGETERTGERLRALEQRLTDAMGARS